MKKTITFNIPEGYIVDKENSTNKNIVLKLAKSERVTTWEEYCKKMDGKESYYCNFTSVKIGSSHFGLEPLVTEFDNLKDTVAFTALGKLLKLRKDWIGEWEPDWTNGLQAKYVIKVQKNKVTCVTNWCVNCSMSFPTVEMCREFYNCFKDLLEKAKILL